MRRKIETVLGTLSIQKSISEDAIRELVEFSQTDPVIARFTSDRQRFATFQAAKNWLSPEKTVYTLSGTKDNLLGIIWFHPMDNPKAPEHHHTFAIRLYGEARGKGLPLKFMEACFADYGKKDVWLVVSHDNDRAISAYLQFGFKRVSSPDEKGKIIMVLTKDRDVKN